MKVYIVYRLGDYAIPQAMSLNRREAERFMIILQKHDPYIHNYWIDEKILSDKVTEI